MKYFVFICSLLKMSSIDPENDDIIENPDPEADSEIVDFTNAAEDEFHFNNNAEDDIHLNSSSQNQFAEADSVGNFSHIEPESERNIPACDIQSNGVNQDRIVDDSTSCAAGQHVNDRLEENSSKNNVSASGISRKESSASEYGNPDEINGEHVEAEADICDSFEAPEAELGIDVPEAELCQGVASDQTESAMCLGVVHHDNNTDQNSSEVNGVNSHSDNITIEENDPHAGALSDISHPDVQEIPRILQLTKSESVESYEPECDQESTKQWNF